MNGEWKFEINCGQSGIDRKFYERDSLSGKILVPFCPESELSGVGNKDFMPAVWYRRAFTLTEEMKSVRVLLHFGAVDYETVVYINEQEVGRHRGGYTALNVYDPKIHIKCGSNTPERVYRMVMDSIRQGRNSFGFVNDELIPEALIGIGQDRQDAQQYTLIGCYEPASIGKEISCSCNGAICMPVAVETALNNGRKFDSDTPTEKRDSR